MGGQTALNCALDLGRHGVLAKYGVELIGAIGRGDRQGRGPPEVQGRDDQDRSRLARARASPTRMEEALQVPGRHRLPGRSSARASRSAAPAAASPTTWKSSTSICKRGLEASPTNEVLIEESLLGWKEYEMEVVRDRADNCIIVCSIENLDPMGVHTGDSITVAPAQTLTDKEYQIMRNASHRGAARDRGGYRRLERAVRHQPAGRSHDRHRDEPARVAFLGAGLQGHRLPDRQGRGQAGGGLHARRAARTTSPAAPRRRPSSPRSTTSSPRSRASPSRSSRRPNDRLTTADEVGGRGHGHGPHLPGVLPEGPARRWRPGVYGLDEIEAGPRRTSSASSSSAGPQRIWYVGQAFREGMSLRAGAQPDQDRPVVPRPDRGHRAVREGARRAAR